MYICLDCGQRIKENEKHSSCKNPSMTEEDFQELYNSTMQGFKTRYDIEKVIDLLKKTQHTEYEPSISKTDLIEKAIEELEFLSLKFRKNPTI